MKSIFNWLLFVDLADKLVSIDAEAAYRSSVSRAYYGVFGEIRSGLKKQGVFFEGINIHYQMISWLENNPKKEISSLGLRLDILRKQRNNADYNSSAVITRLTAIQTVSQSRLILDQAKIFKLI